MKCPRCGKNISWNDDFCQFCGLPNPKVVGNFTKPQKNQKACPKCFKIQDKNEEFCQSCGHSFIKNAQHLSVGQKKQNLQRKNVDQAYTGDFEEFLKKWNWGAAGLTFIWGVYFQVWIAFMMFIPVINWFWWIVLGIKGTEWAYQAKKWKSQAYFKEQIEKWNKVGIILFFFFIAYTAFSIYVFFNDIFN